MSPFQTVVLTVFGVMLTLAVLVFAGLIPGFKADQGQISGQVVMWGTVPDRQMQPLLTRVSEDYGNFDLIYVPKDKESFEQEFVEALATGNGPDLVILSEDLMIKQRNKLLPIPPEYFSVRSFRDTYVDSAEVYQTDLGLVALPLAVDPVVMYYNRDILANAGVAQVPKLWSEFTAVPVSVTDKLTVRDERNTVTRSAIALGEYGNVKNAKDILALLMLQAGNPLVALALDASGQMAYQTTLSDNRGFSETPAAAAVGFYTQFADPARATYTWNSAMPDSQQAFVSEILAFYLGYASEIWGIRAQNPHLAFDVAMVPQRTSSDNRTMAHLYGVGVVRGATDPAAAYGVAFLLADQGLASLFAQIMGMPPARKDLLAAGNEDPFGALFYQAAIGSRAWPDPDARRTDEIFGRMIGSVRSGSAAVAEAVARAQDEIAGVMGR